MLKLTMNRIAVYAGSFDPITYGHLDIIRKASELYDKVIIGVSINNKKHCMFTLEERKKQINQIIRGIGYTNVIVKSFEGLTVDFAKKENAQYLICGVRDTNDCLNELKIANINKKLNPNIETNLLVSDDKYKCISSSLIKEIANNNGNISWLVPNEIRKEIEKKMM
jgi:pantetheine-phosphate adenylyltransferase